MSDYLKSHVIVWFILTMVSINKRVALPKPELGGLWIDLCQVSATWGCHCLTWTVVYWGGSSIFLMRRYTTKKWLQPRLILFLLCRIPLILGLYRSFQGGAYPLHPFPRSTPGRSHFSSSCNWNITTVRYQHHVLLHVKLAEGEDAWYTVNFAMLSFSF